MKDPRPVVTDLRVHGVVCETCGLAMATARPRCAECRSSVTAAEFGPEGSVFASTIVRIAVADRVPPYALAYVNLDNGPRVLAHVVGPLDLPPQVGGRVRLLPQVDGDLRVEVTR